MTSISTRFGENAHPSSPKQIIDQLVKAMAEYEKDFEMRIYSDAPHTFFNDTSKATYKSDAANDAWDRVLRFLARTLSTA